MSCSAEPPALDSAVASAPEPIPYLYKIPSKSPHGLTAARVKNEALAEAFVSRLSTKAPVGVVVLQHEKLVLEEYFKRDSTVFISTGPLFPAYTGALLARVYAGKNEVPYKTIPLQDFYPPVEQKAPLMMRSNAFILGKNQESFQVDKLNALLEEQLGTTQGMAAEELLFEPLLIDDYTWKDGSLHMHPHGVLQLASLWLRRGRWGDKQLLPDRLVQRVLEPAYAPNTENGIKQFGWQYFRLMAKGRKQPVLYWQNGSGAHLFLFPEVEAVVLLQSEQHIMPEAWEWLQQYLIPSISP